MITKFNRNNHNFQIAYFIAGSCHTPDAAYISLINLQRDRQCALDTAESVKLKQEAERIRCERKIASDDLAEQLDGQAGLLELSAQSAQQLALIQAAQEELAFIELCIERVQPMRKYGDLSDAEAAEAVQMEEWAHELKHRAENYMLTSGTIPPDHFSTMRLHPAFTTHILPHIETVQLALREPDGYQKLLSTSQREFDIPALLGVEAIALPGHVQE